MRARNASYCENSERTRVSRTVFNLTCILLKLSLSFLVNGVMTDDRPSVGSTQWFVSVEYLFEMSLFQI